MISETIRIATDPGGNKEREFKGLPENLELYDPDQGLILTRDQEGSMKMEGKDIPVKSVWPRFPENCT